MKIKQHQNYDQWKHWSNLFSCGSDLILFSTCVSRLHLTVHCFLVPGKTCGVGPGLVFATSYLRAHKSKNKGTPTPVIGLVPCAIGGTSITQWEKGGTLYNQMINRTRAALENGGKLTALLWYQGESDAIEKKLADQYKENLITFFKSVRADLNKDDLPIIQVSRYGVLRILYLQN